MRGSWHAVIFCLSVLVLIVPHGKFTVSTDVWGITSLKGLLRGTVVSAAKAKAHKQTEIVRARSQVLVATVCSTLLEELSTAKISFEITKVPCSTLHYFGAL